MSPVFFFILMSLEGLAVSYSVLRIPGEARSQMLFGLSTERLAMVVVLLAVTLVLVCLAAWSVKNRSRVQTWLSRQRSNPSLMGWVHAAAIVGGLAAWVVLFLPSYQTSPFEAYYERLRPIILWLGVGTVQALLVFKSPAATIRKKWQSLCSALRDSDLSTRPFLSSFLVLALLWLVIIVTGWGIRADNVHWNDTGAPLLGLQVLTALVMGLVFSWFERGIQRSRTIRNGSAAGRFSIDPIVCAALWLAAAFLWLRAPMPHSYFAPGPYPPNNEYYPFSDAAGYDVSAQYALIGQGLENHSYVDKPLYSTFLLGAHLIAGQQSDPVIAVQVGLLAFLPVVLFLLGKSLHSRAAGLAAGVLLIFRELNTIAATLILMVSNSRLMMSEGLTTLFMALLALCLVRWLRSRPPNRLALMCAGGVLGLATLVRHNPWFLLPFILLFAAITHIRNWRQMMVSSALFCGMVLVSILPWMWRSQQVYGSPFYFMIPLRGVVLSQRYNYGVRRPVQVSPVVTATPEPTPTLEPTATVSVIQPAVTTQPAATPNATQKTLRFIGGTASFITYHFFHNLISTAAVIPDSLRYDDLDYIIKNTGGFWDAQWNGWLPAGETFLLGLNLGLVALGLGFAWRRHRWAGIMPAVVFAGYNLATALARTSGGRYILPVDWVGYFYYAIGLVHVFEWLLQPSFISADGASGEGGEQHAGGLYPINPAKPRVRSGMMLAAAFFLTGLTLPLSEIVFPLRYPPQTSQELVNSLDESGMIERLGTTRSEMDIFLKSPNSVVLQGRGLYPRYYGIDQGEPDRFSANRVQAFPRVVFTLIGSHGQAQGVLPLNSSPRIFVNGADVLIIGCHGQMSVDVWAMVVKNPEEVIYTRNPAVPLACPFQEPVCNNNRVCH